MAEDKVKVKDIDKELDEIAKKEKNKPKNYSEPSGPSFGRRLGGSSSSEETEEDNTSNQEVKSIFNDDFIKAIEDRVNKKLNGDKHEEKVVEAEVSEPVTEVITEPVTTPATEPQTMPPTQPMTEPQYVQTEQVIKSIQEDRQGYEQQKMYQSGFKPTATIKLEDKQTEDNFFDDFFDD